MVKLLFEVNMPSEMKTKVTNGEGKGGLNLCHFLVVGALEPFLDRNALQ